MVSLLSNQLATFQFNRGTNDSLPVRCHRSLVVPALFSIPFATVNQRMAAGVCQLHLAAIQHRCEIYAHAPVKLSACLHVTPLDIFQSCRKFKWHRRMRK